MGELIFLAGIVLTILGMNGTEHCGVIGVFALAFGLILIFIKVGDEEARARINRRRYWAYGEEPDWKRNRR